MFLGRLRSLLEFYGLGRAYRPGELVRHRSYGYRGVIVAVDEQCLAPDDWYNGNRSQPEREQPWYHVLVHRSGSMTYAAHENLAADSNSEPVEHPLLGHFFSGFQDGAHVRNDEDWPGWPDADAEAEAEDEDVV